MTTKRKQLIKKITSLSELGKLAEQDDNYKKLCIAALQNLGCEHLANERYHSEQDRVKWKLYYRGLYAYWEALCCEYGVPEEKAERQIVAEINHVRDCIDQISLT